MKALTALELRTLEKTLKWWFLLIYCLVFIGVAAIVLIKDETSFSSLLNILGTGLASTLAAVFGITAYVNKFQAPEVEKEVEELLKKNSSSKDKSDK